MKRIRIGNDVKVEWSVTEDGRPMPFEGRDIQVSLLDPLSRVCDVKSLLGDNGKIIIEYSGKGQRLSGPYQLFLVCTDRDGRRLTVDANAFELVPRSSMSGGCCDCGCVSVETVDIHGDTMSGVPGFSAYEVWLQNGNDGTEDDFLQWLQGNNDYRREKDIDEEKNIRHVWLEDKDHEGRRIYTETDADSVVDTEKRKTQAEINRQVEEGLESLEKMLVANDAMVLAGTINGTGVILKHNSTLISSGVSDRRTNISDLKNYNVGWTFRVGGTDGNNEIDGIGKVEVGDMVVCVNSYKESYDATDWSVLQSNVDMASKDAAGLMSATDKANLDDALVSLDGINAQIKDIKGSIANVKDTADALVDGRTKAKKAETADSAGTANLATKAAQDENGRVISETYALRGTAVATQDLGKYVPVNKHTGGTLAFPLATQSAGGAMSSADKKKLDDAEGTYYSSFNVTGTGWYRLVNVPKTRWLDKYLVVNILNVEGTSAHNSFKIYYNSSQGWGDYKSNSFICVPLTRTNAQCVGDVRLVYLGGAKAQYIDAYIILPSGTTNLSVSIKSNIDAQYLAKNPVGADGKEGVAEAVLVALPEGYSSIVRNAYVDNTDDASKRVVGGLFSERSLQDINGARIDAQYATKTEMNSYLPETLKAGGYLDLMIENTKGQQCIPLLQNDIAYFIEKGGDVTCTIDGNALTLSAEDKSKIANGTTSYLSFTTTQIPSANSVVVFELSLNQNFRYYNIIYVAFQSTRRAKDTKVEVYAPSIDEWAVVWDRKNQADGIQYLKWENTFKGGSNNTPWDKIRLTMTNFTGIDQRLRISEIGVISYDSANATAICLPRNGGEIYGGITPLNDNAYDLGASGKAWKNVYAKQLTSTAAEGTAPLVVSSKTMVANLNAQYARMLSSNSNAPVNAGNYYKPVYFSGGVPVACNVLDKNKNFGGIPYVSTAGYFPIGKKLQFHTTSDEDTNKNANLRITARDANDANGEGLTIGGTTIASGKFAQHSGVVCSSIADLSSYWGKLWSGLWNYTTNDLDVTIYIHSAFMNKRGIVHLRVRFESTKNEDGTYTGGNHIISISQIVGNLTPSSFRLYYKCDINASTGGVTNGQIELWCNIATQYGVYNAVLLSATGRTSKENTDFYGTFYNHDFTTVQTPTLTDYVEMTNVVISQTAANATNSDRIFIRQDNTTNKDLPIPWLSNGDATQKNVQVYKSFGDLSYNPVKKRITTGLFKGCLDSVAVPSAENNILQYISGGIPLGDDDGNAKEGSNADPNLWSYPTGSTFVSATHANIQTLRFTWSYKYFHDLFMSPNQKTLWHRWVFNGTAYSWRKIVEATEDGKVIIEGKTYEDTLRIKNKDRSTGEIHIFNGEQGNAVIRHYEGSTPTDLKFNSTQVMHGSKTLAYAEDLETLRAQVEALTTQVQALTAALNGE